MTDDREQRTEIGGQRSESREQRAEVEGRKGYAASAVCAPSSVGRRLAGLRAVLPDRTGHLIFWSIAVVGLAVDLWTKAAVFSSVGRNGELTIIGDILTFHCVENAGAAFGIAAGKQLLLAGVSIVATVAIVAIFLLGGMRRRIAQVALGLFVAGVCGNLWDRLFNEGRVRDFVNLDLGFWPVHPWNTFNIADALLCAAVGLLAIASFFTPATPSQTPAPTQKSEP